MKKKKGIKILPQEVCCFFRLSFAGAMMLFHTAVFAVPPESADGKDERTFIKGKVTDRDGIPLPGVTVRQENTTLGTATNQHGEFTLYVRERTGTLLFTFVGFKTGKVRFEAGDFLEVVLEESVNELDEVRVVAYGEQSRREMVGAISVVKADEIRDIPSSSIANLLQGRVPGMDVVNMTGAPGGSGTVVTIRGFNSLSIEGARRYSDPLWVVDGVKMKAGNIEGSGLSMLADIDPHDIESVQVLKDASSSAIYGSEAANGVIIITTKKGKLNQKPKLNLSLSKTFSFAPVIPHLIGGNKERYLRQEALRNFQRAYYVEALNTYKYPETYEESYLNGVQHDYFWNAGNGATITVLQDSLNPFFNNATNLFDYYFRTARVLNANMQLTGGTEYSSYHIGMGYYGEKGVLRRTGFNRINLLTNLQVKPYPGMEANVRFYLSRSGKDRSGKGTDSYRINPEGDLETIPDELMFTSTLLPGEGHPAFEEMVKRYEKTIEKNETYRLRFSFDIGYEFFKGLKLKSSIAVDYSQQNQSLFIPSELDDYHETYSSAGIRRDLMWLNENLLTYRHTYGGHTIDLLAGLSMQENEKNRIYGYGKRAPSDLIHYVSWSGNVFDTEANRALKDFGSDISRSTMVSLFARAAYHFKEKYLASVTVRRDGSSRFGENTRWGTFPSVGLGYAFSEEPFLREALPILDYGKLRLSWGMSGKQFESPYLAFGVISPGSRPFLGQPMMEPYWRSGLINRELSWEETSQWDAGLDLHFFNYRLGVTLDYYYRYTDKLLYSVPLPGNYNGYSLQWQNAYAISNSGIECQIEAEPIRNGKFNWKMTFNIARNWNRLEKSRNGTDLQNPVSVNNLSVIGKPLNGIYVLQSGAYYQTQDEVPYRFDNGRKQYLGGSSRFYRPGDRIIADVNGDGEIDYGNTLESDRVYAGSPLPLAQGGMTHQLSWKGFELNLLFSYALGRHILNAGNISSVGTILASNPLDMMRPVFAHPEDLVFWQKPGDAAKYPFNRVEDYLCNFTSNVSSCVEKVSYLKLKSLSLGYTFPKEKLGFVTRLYFSAENLFTLTNYTGNDPETVDILTGIDAFNNYPLGRKITLGINLIF